MAKARKPRQEVEDPKADVQSQELESQSDGTADDVAPASRSESVAQADETRPLLHSPLAGGLHEIAYRLGLETAKEGDYPSHAAMVALEVSLANLRNAITVGRVRAKGKSLDFLNRLATLI